MSNFFVVSDIPLLRVRATNAAAVRTDGEFVLYWMTANRRTRWNYSLQRAVDWSRSLKKPLLVLEALRTGYRWASDRFHYFVIQGMADNAQWLEGQAATYYPYLERKAGDGSGLIAALSQRACVVISDDFPCFFLPQMMAAAARQIPVKFELIDSNGILPMHSANKAFARAFDFRRFLQKELREHLVDFPQEDPLQGVRLPMLETLPTEIRRRWPAADIVRCAANATTMSEFPIDHRVPVAAISGGAVAAEKRLQTFLAGRLSSYDELHSDPDEAATSGLSHYLHFGHLAAHKVFADIMRLEQWSLGKLASKVTGSSRGWWGVNPSAEGFLDQLITWRELGFNMCSQRRDYKRYSSLPDWARTTLEEHASDPRPFVYSFSQFEQAQTHDPLWNAAQRQLVREGKIHNYLRMLWGKKILEWSPSPEAALEVMVELNNKYALDGRDPNSYSGIFWILGRYDRAWGPERPIFGKIRYMSSDNTARKLHVDRYLDQYGPSSQASLW